MTRELVRQLLNEKTKRIRSEVGEEVWTAGRPADTRSVFETVALGEDFPPFTTSVAYGLLETNE